MTNKEVLNTDLLRARIMDGEYHHLTVKEVKRIYIEETGKEPPAEITVYHSDDLQGFEEGDYGFDGTAIHFYDEEKGINQIYTIPRGTEPKESGTWKPLDYTYDGMGISSSFVDDLKKMEHIGSKWVKFVDGEVEHCKGKTVGKVIETVEKREEINQVYHDAYQSSMKNMASNYSEHIRDMAWQEITYYYKVHNMTTG